MMQKMQKGEYNFHDFQQRTNEKTDLSMSKKEALEILGLPESATKQEINTAYHKLMQKNHPDKGGSHYLAKQINKARDILLK
jgi:DnaJ-class molecular chaperone